jgi:protein-tyrosine kinase
MSRVDQALSRLAGTYGAAVGTDSRTEPVEHRSVLEQYPEEFAEPAAQPAPLDGTPAPADEVHRAPSFRAIRTSPAVVRQGLEERDFWRDGRLVVSAAASPVAVLGYRQLASALHDFRSAHGLRVVMVASALPGEGKTLTTVNLGLTLSEFMGRRVLLIDGNLQQPALHTMFQLTSQAGLNEYLRFELDEIPVVELSGQLCVLPAGRPDIDGVAALTSDRMEDLVDHLADRFDWVLLDTPPVAHMREAELLAGIAGGVLLVIRAESTPYTMAARAIARLDPARVVGAVLNGVTDVSDMGQLL